jgi:hypothetical protein
MVRWSELRLISAPPLFPLAPQALPPNLDVMELAGSRPRTGRGEAVKCSLYLNRLRPRDASRTRIKLRRQERAVTRPGDGWVRFWIYSPRSLRDE